VTKILVVDDDPRFRQSVRRLLVARGLDVVGEADSAAAAAAAALDLKPDAVLIDVGLSDDDGVSLAARLTTLPWSPRVLLTSTDPEAVGEDDVRRSGALGFLPKLDLPDAPLRQLLAAD